MKLQRWRRASGPARRWKAVVAKSTWNRAQRELVEAEARYRAAARSSRGKR